MGMTDSRYVFFVLVRNHYEVIFTIEKACTVELVQSGTRIFRHPVTSDKNE